VTGRVLVTGGAGFIGSAVVRRLVAKGRRVRVFDNLSRGDARRLAGIEDRIEFIHADIRDPAAVAEACEGQDEIHHLAAVNGTRFFYEQPELVLDVAVRGMLNVIDGARRHGVRRLALTSSSEVYQTPPHVPTAEDAPLTVPDVLNPRYSYGGGKIASELMAINYGRNGFDKVVIVRPHNVYGPDMGFEHVIPEFVLRMNALPASGGPHPFAIQGDGRETRAFVHVDDFADGFMLCAERGEHLGIYHLGTREEVSVAILADRIAGVLGRNIALQPGPLTAGSTLRRCPDIARAEALGYRPGISLAAGLAPTVDWYAKNASLAPAIAR
jgi:nucleoside-diphosphate-sugar epimerase